ncbi:hypothetical protein KSP39_PZI023361 [Platanthera zijinensis]|uniref:Retrotransposon gag domain-containing protein n=1 Tax=Platanthera zijinensis TaxID=2320716 RepID=A0AAP0AV99_9ASPA
MPPTRRILRGWMYLSELVPTSLRAGIVYTPISGEWVHESQTGRSRPPHADRKKEGKTALAAALSPPAAGESRLRSPVRGRIRTPLAAIFVPRYHNLQQDKQTIDEYTNEFLVLQSRLDLNEDDHMVVARYLNGLRYAIRNQLELHDFRDLGEISSRARRVEALQKRRSGQRSTDGPRSTDRPTSSTTTTPTPTTTDSPPLAITGAPTLHPGPSRGKEPIGARPHTGFVVVIDSTTGGEPEYGVFLSDPQPEPLPEADSFIEVEGEQPEHLVCVLHSGLVTSSKTTEQDPRRKEIFRTTARIQEHFYSIIIDSGSMENYVSQQMVEKLGLLTRPLKQPYHLSGVSSPLTIPLLIIVSTWEDLTCIYVVVFSLHSTTPILCYASAWDLAPGSGV